MDGRMDAWIDGRIDGRVCTHIHMDARMDVWVDRQMDVYSVRCIGTSIAMWIGSCRIFRWMDGWMNGWMDTSTDGATLTCRFCWSECGCI